MAPKQAGMHATSPSTKPQVVKTGNLLSAEDFFRGGDDPYRRVEIPELVKNGEPGIVYVKSLTTGQVFDFAERVNPETNPSANDRSQAMLEMIARAIVTEDGAAIFDTPEKVSRLREVSMAAYKRLSTAVNEMAGIVAKEEQGKG